jgi:hypothetical protein
LYNIFDQFLAFEALILEAFSSGDAFTYSPTSS